MRSVVVGVVFALALPLLGGVLVPPPASAACGASANFWSAKETCTSRPAQGGAKSAANRSPRKKRAFAGKPVCALRVGGACVRGVPCTDASGQSGSYVVIASEGVKRPGRACVPAPSRPGQPVAPAPPAVSDALVARVMRTLDWQVPGLAVQPPGGATLVNLATNVFARGERVQTLTTQLLTRRVTIEARAVRYEWSFGDGARLTTAQPGRPYPALDVTHRYPAPGRFRLTLATSFTGRFRVDDGPWRPVPGELRLVAPAQPLRVVEARPQLRGE